MKAAGSVAPSTDVIRALAGEVHVWLARLPSAIDSMHVFARILTEKEHQHSLRFKFEEDRTRFVCTRGILRLLLSDYLRLNPEAISILDDHHRKPTLTGGQNCEQVEFNVSHSHEMMVLAFAQGFPVGVDVEYRRSQINAREIAHRSFSAAESAALVVSDENSVDLFYRIWTRKEAYLKALGTGITTVLTSFSVSHGTDAYLQSSIDHDDPSQWTLKDLHAGPEYSAAIAYRSTSARIKSLTWPGI